MGGSLAKRRRDAEKCAWNILFRSCAVRKDPLQISVSQSVSDFENAKKRIR